VWWMGVRVTDVNAELIQMQTARADLLEVQSLATEAESGSRGYVITGNEKYLGPYREAIERLHKPMAEVKESAAAGRLKREDVEKLDRLMEQRMGELGQMLEALRVGGRDAAGEIVQSGEGQRRMEELRAHVDGMVRQTVAKEGALSQRRDDATRTRTLSAIMSALLTLGLVVWAYQRLAKDAAER